MVDPGGTEVAIGVDVGGTTTKGGLVTPEGRIVDRAEWPTDATAGTRAIIGVATALSERAARTGLTVIGLGIGAAGFVDAERGAITFSPNIDYDEPEIGRALARQLPYPVFVDNDANAAAWGERMFGAARGRDDVVMLTLGTGLGAGFVVGGRVLRGATGAAAELGHTIVDPGGPACPCGLQGCLEQLVSGNAIARLGREAARQHPDSLMVELAGSIEAISARSVSEAAQRGDAEAGGILRQAGRALGIGLSNVVNIFDPAVIVLGGAVVHAGDPLLGPARDQMNAMLAAQGRRPQRLVVAELRNDAGLIGAAALALAESTEEGAGAMSSRVKRGFGRA